MAQRMTDEEKKAFAEKMKAARSKSAAAEPETAPPKTFTAEEVAAMLEEATKKAVEDALAKARATTASSAEVVTVLYMAEVSRDNVLILPEYGSLRPNSALEVPKKEFGGKFMSPLARKLIEKRHLLVLDGLTDDERRRWNCYYHDGEVLDERTFDKMLDYDIDKLAAIFKMLCPEHQRFVARRFISARERNDNRVSFDKVKVLNDISKEHDPNGMFKPLIEGYKQDIE